MVDAKVTDTRGMAQTKGSAERANTQEENESFKENS